MSDIKKVSASPKARKFARELGTNINEILGSKRGGRVTEDDIKNYVSSKISNKSQNNLPNIKNENSIIRLRCYFTRSNCSSRNFRERL